MPHLLTRNGMLFPIPYFAIPSGSTSPVSGWYFYEYATAKRKQMADGRPLRKLQAKTFTIDMFVCDVPCGGYIRASGASDFGSRRNKYFPCASVRVPHARKKLATRTWPRQWQIVENGKGAVGSVVTTLAVCGSWKCNFWWDGAANSGPGSKTISQTTIKRGLLQSIVVVLAGMGPVCLRRWET